MAHANPARGQWLHGLSWSTIGGLFGRRAAASASLSPISRQVRDARLTYLRDQKLARIEHALKDISREGVQGCFVECGVALGGSGIIIATLMPEGRQFHGYDVFGMIPPPTSEKDDQKSRARYEAIRSGQSQGIGGDPYYGYVEDLYERVVKNFARFGQTVDQRRVALHKGLFQDTLQPTTEIAFAHIDCDWYDPVKLCLDRIVPCLSAGGYVVLDDYNDYGGCRRAVDEFLETGPAIEVIAREPNFVFRRRREPPMVIEPGSAGA
jgi:asparagine synthase (glutamine-hydrolysing)